MKRNSLTLLLLLVFTEIYAQTYFTKTAQISFFSSTPLEDIDAVTKSGTCFTNLKSGEVVFAVLMKSFVFKRDLMQEHFNENYVESDKYPKATFKGKINNLTSIKLDTDGTYNVEVSGEMNMHGVSKPLNVKGTVKIIGDNLELKASFSIKPEDYNIKIPSLVVDKIAKVVEVKVNSVCKPYKN